MTSVIFCGPEQLVFCQRLYNVSKKRKKRKPSFNPKSLKIEKKNHEIVISG